METGMADWSEATLRERIETTRGRMDTTVERIAGLARAGRMRSGTKSRPGFDRDDFDLREQLARLTSDAVQLVHDELELAKFEMRDVSDALSEDVGEAGQTLVRDLGRTIVAVSIGFLATLALAVALVLALGELLGGAFWASALLVSVILAVMASLFVHSAIHELGSTPATKLENAMRMIRRGSLVIRDDVRDTGSVGRRTPAGFARNVRAGRVTWTRT